MKLHLVLAKSGDVNPVFSVLSLAKHQGWWSAGKELVASLSTAFHHVFEFSTFKNKLGSLIRAIDN